MIVSPCCRNCCLNMDDVCLGCGRTYTEIIAWHSADDSGKMVILSAAAERLSKRQQTALGVPCQPNLDNSN
jgi:predicted Fe-S protein YdhL (DUF1289 family)